MNLVKRFLCDSRDQWWRLAILTLALILAASFEIIAPRLLGNIVAMPSFTASSSSRKLRPF